MQDTIDWFGSWNDLWDTVFSALLFYIVIVVLVRLTGKRSTSQLNNFDWIINITVGSLAASGILLDSVPAVRAMAAIVTIMCLQYLMTWAVLHWDWAASMAKAKPTMLTHKGAFLEKGMRKTRVSQEEICSALREHGKFENRANWVVIETDGRLTVLPEDDIELQDAATMQNVEVLDDLDAVRADSRA